VQAKPIASHPWPQRGTATWTLKIDRLASNNRGSVTRHREAHFGDIGRGPVRIACLRVAIEMLGQALA